MSADYSLAQFVEALRSIVATVTGSTLKSAWLTTHSQEERTMIRMLVVSARAGMKPEGFPSHLKLFPSRVQLAEKLTEYNRRYEALFIK
jgi:hypothetical protein